MFLKSVEGKQRSEKEAVAIATDVSKYLAFANAKALDWEKVWELREVNRYLSHLEELGLGVDGQLSKLDRIGTALDFCKLDLFTSPRHASNYHLCQQAEERLRRMKRTLRPLKERKREERSEDLSKLSLSFSEITEVIENRNVWNFFATVVNNIEKGRGIDQQDLIICVAAVMAILLFCNLQRPGAVTNMTMSEYYNGETVSHDGQAITVFKVKEHKTRNKGTAKVSLDEKKIKYLHEYVQHIRPRLVPGDSELVFVLPGGKPIEKANNLLKKLERFGISVPTATRARKIDETAASSLSPKK